MRVSYNKLTDARREVDAVLDQAIIEFGSPTLARLKFGSLFTVSIGQGFAEELRGFRTELAAKGVALTVLRVRDGRALMYLYRPGELAAAIAREDVWRFLASCGYDTPTVPSVLAHLRRRLRACPSFPHEIGVFLEYPLSDVLAFIRNGGRNCLCCGCWKVYSNECDALRAFARFRKCKEVYGRLFAAGRSLSRLTVAARTA